MPEIPEFPKRILKKLNRAGFEAYIVGGAVRDFLLGNNPHDYDIATSATPEEILKTDINAVSSDKGTIHGTVKVYEGDFEIEITTFRKDGEYKDSRRPDSVFFTRDVKEDAIRRDFTINALYMDADGNVKDFTGGVEDLKKKVIRAIGNPEIRFNEDALRIMRALRFASRLEFDIDPETKAAMEKCKDLLANISGERIGEELTGLIVHKGASKVIRENTEIFGVIIPEIKAMEGFDQKSKYHDLDVLEHTLKVLDNLPLDNGVRDISLSFAALIHDMGKPESFFLDQYGVGHMYDHEIISERIAKRIAEDIKLKGVIRDEVISLVKFHDTFVDANKPEVYRFIISLPHQALDKLEILQYADIMAHSKLGMKRLEEYEKIRTIKKEIIEEKLPLSIPQMDITGNDLALAGIPKGKKTGEVLNILFNLIIEGELNNNNRDLMEYVKRNMTEYM